MKIMMRNEKGLSDVITTVLIVLLALAAVVIIWGFVRPALERGGEGITKQSVCFDVDIQPTTCTAGAAGTATVSYKNNGGQEVSAVNIIVENPTTGQTNVESGSGITPYGSVPNEQIDNFAIAAGDNVRVAAVVLSDGESYSCDPAPTSVDC